MLLKFHGITLSLKNLVGLEKLRGKSNTLAVLGEQWGRCWGNCATFHKQIFLYIGSKKEQQKQMNK